MNFQVYPTFIFTICILSFGFANAYEGPIKNSYTVSGKIEFVSCYTTSSDPMLIKNVFQKYGPADKSGHCINDSKEDCNIPVSFILFDYSNTGAKLMEVDEADCNDVAVKKSCAYFAMAIKSLPNGSDVVNVKTSISSDSNQKVTSENNYPIATFINNERSFTQTANGCYRYELKVTVLPTP